MSTAWRLWALRAIAGFAVVYGLGALGIATLIPYIAVVLAVSMDAVRTARLTRASGRPKRSRG